MQAYVGGLFREQGLDVVKQWLDPLFRPLIEVAYEAERRDYLMPGSASPATPPGIPTPSWDIEIPSKANVDARTRLRSRTTRNSLRQPSSVPNPLQRVADRPNTRRKRHGDSLVDGGSGDAGKTPP